MDENSLFTPFDEITQTRELQMLKTIIPYMPHDSQKQMTLMVHYISLMNSMRMIDSAPALSVAETESMSDRRLSMLNALRKNQRTQQVPCRFSWKVLRRQSVTA